MPSASATRAMASNQDSAGTSSQTREPRRRFRAFVGSRPTVVRGRPSPRCRQRTHPNRTLCGTPDRWMVDE
jgi:hypothetical protein